MHYDPTAESVRRHALPSWFRDAKLGIFIHWGLYSVPGWATAADDIQTVFESQGPAAFFKENPYAEWYANTIRIDGSSAQRHHIETYGPDFTYDRFRPQFEADAERMDPNQWAALIEAAGAQYIVLTTKHHEGYTLWPTSVRNPHNPGWSARRDLVGEITDAVRAAGMRVGLYYSGGYDWTFDDTIIRDLATAAIAMPQTKEYAAYADAQIHELIDRYEPDVLWNDIGYPPDGDVAALLAHLYNAVPDSVVNDRWAQVRLPKGDVSKPVFTSVVGLVSRAWPYLPKVMRGYSLPGGMHADFTTPEYTRHEEIQTRAWETCRGIGNSFGNNRQESAAQMLGVADLVHLLIDVVAAGGNLLIGLGPYPDGTIPDLQEARVRALGRWLQENGRAIYGTRSWTRSAGVTREGGEVRFTQSDDAVYALVYDAPHTPELTIEDVPRPAGDTVELIGHGSRPWYHEDGALTVTFPSPLPIRPAHVIAIPT